MRKDIGCAGSMIESVDNFQPSPFSFSFRCSLLHSGFSYLALLPTKHPSLLGREGTFQPPHWQFFRVHPDRNCIKAYVSLFLVSTINYTTEIQRTAIPCRTAGFFQTAHWLWLVYDQTWWYASSLLHLCVMPPTSTVILIPSVFPIHAMPLLPGFVLLFFAWPALSFTFSHPLLSLLHFGKLPLLLCRAVSAWYTHHQANQKLLLQQPNNKLMLTNCALPLGRPPCAQGSTASACVLWIRAGSTPFSSAQTHSYLLHHRTLYLWMGSPVLCSTLHTVNRRCIRTHLPKDTLPLPVVSSMLSSDTCSFWWTHSPLHLKKICIAGIALQRKTMGLLFIM